MLSHSTQREELQSTAESTSHVKNLHELMMDDVGKSGLEAVHSQVEENEHKTKQQSDTVSEEKMRGKKVKEKVRDFIKRFNSEGSPKRDQKMRKKDKNKIGENRQGPLSPSVSESSREEKSHELKFEEAFVFAYSQLSQTNQVQQKVQENAFESSSEPQRSGDSSLERNQTFQPTSVGQTHEAQNESNLEDFEECLVEHSIEEPSEALNVSIDQDQTKISESKIREWSKGKEGNIRSLLSTLQSVLWPGSGWKPVPLVSIIEAPAVKRAYQKALLCLHPDKLQQRGAAPHEKYIAERVFEILQEAWNQFTL
ncbi:Chaperone DnaJ-domain superfamily protein [Rhynchospora pubera]|uniref:Chaperone DnaJ-domain superfamily protein n=1 Tax=Rhynchospora pubera TaxID=906938 RepID=A0AAV8DE60_9POAL|nr:Chaperone DnaJ-domain superfamily protein [Rhynchospora pubera]